MSGILRYLDVAEETKSVASAGIGYPDVPVRSLVTMLTTYVGFWESRVKNGGKNILYEIEMGLPSACQYWLSLVPNSSLRQKRITQANTVLRSGNKMRLLL
jgi:hypothetical protein